MLTNFIRLGPKFVLKITLQNGGSQPVVQVRTDLCVCVCVCVRFCVCTVLQSFVCCYCYCCCSYYHLNHKYSSLLLFLMLFLSPTILILIHSLGFYSLSILICTAKDIAVATVKAFLSRYFFRYNIFYIHFFPNYFYLLISCVFFCTQLSLTPPLYS